MAKTAIVVARKVDSKIFSLRGQRVILDADLADSTACKSATSISRSSAMRNDFLPRSAFNSLRTN